MEQQAQDQPDSVRMAIPASGGDEDKETEDNNQAQRETSGPNALGDGHIKLGSAQKPQTLDSLMQDHQVTGTLAVHPYFTNFHTWLSTFLTQLL